MDGKELITQEQYQEAGKYYLDNILGPAEFFTGLVSSNRSQIFKSVGHAAQGLLMGKFLQTLQQEYGHYKDAGKIKEDFRYTDQNQMCFTELLKFLEQEMPDMARFDLLKKIYIVAATEECSDRTSPLPFEFMRLAETLNQGEIVVLFAAHRIAKRAGFPTKDRIEIWYKMVGEESGLKYNELVLIHDHSLASKRLLDTIQKSTEIIFHPHFRLTDLGMAFCDYVAHYDELNVDI